MPMPDPDDVATVEPAPLIEIRAEALVLECEPPAAGPAPEPSDVERLTAALAEQERKAGEWEKAYQRAVRDKELAAALAAQPLVRGALEQLLKLWADELEASVADGQVTVMSRDGLTAAEAVTEWLSRPEFAHFCQPSTRGGAATVGAARPARPEPPPPPRNLGEAAIQQWREQSARGAGASATIGLRRRPR